jgi:membrane fusion protein (multidrug efflux system)
MHHRSSRPSRRQPHRTPAGVQVFRVPALGLALALALLAGCGSESDKAPAAAAAPPPAVIAVPARLEPIDEQAEFVGRVAAVDRVELRARVPGFLKERRFTEGQQVKADQPLFLIEPDQYQAVVDQRKADVAKAVAEDQNAKAQLARGEELLKSKNISAAEVDKLRAAGAVAKASIEQAKAAQAAAELDLSYTQIKAPVAGRIGLAKYTIGNLVGPESGTLATLVSHDPVYLQFPLTQREVLEARRTIKTKGGDPKDVVVRARLPDGSLYEQSGSINFIDVTTDQGTDSVTLRAQIPNPEGILVDGQFVGVVVQAGKPQTAILVPQSALQLDQQGTFVMIVDAEGKARVRRVKLGATKGASVAVAEGLKDGDLVIAEGVQKVRPGQPVTAAPPQSVEKAEGLPAAQEAGAAAGGKGQ